MELYRIHYEVINSKEYKYIVQMNSLRVTLCMWIRIWRWPVEAWNGNVTCVVSRGIGHSRRSVLPSGLE